MMKRVLIGAVVALCGMSVSAQTDSQDFGNTTVEQRLGHGRDSIANREAYNRYAQAYRKQDWKTCYQAWHELFWHAPFASYNVTYYAATVVQMLQNLIKEEQTVELRWRYFQDAMETFDFAIENCKSLNTFTDVLHPILTPGTLKCQKAHFHKLLLESVNEWNDEDKCAFAEESYALYKDAFATLAEEGGENGEGIAPFFVEEYYEVCQAHYELDKEQFFPDFLADYVQCIDICDKMQTRDSSNKEYYAGARNNIEVFFNQTGACSPERLEGYYAPRLEENKKNAEFLRGAISLMVQHGCVGTRVFYQYCEAAYALQPDYLNCIGKGFACLDGEYQGGALSATAHEDAKKHFDQARSLAKTPKEKYLATKCSADALAATPCPKKAEGESVADFNARLEDWRNLMCGAAVYYDAALGLAAQAEVSEAYAAELHNSQAICYYKAEEYEQALQSLDRVKQTYPQYPDAKIAALREAIQRGAERKREREEACLQQLKTDAQREAWRKKQEDLDTARKAELKFWSNQNK